jgi:hypothetical protein
MVGAGLYWHNHLRYYWGSTAGAPEHSLDVTSGAAGTTSGVFELHTRRATALPGGTGYPFFGWAWIRLTPVVTTIAQSASGPEDPPFR